MPREVPTSGKATMCDFCRSRAPQLQVLEAHYHQLKFPGSSRARNTDAHAAAARRRRFCCTNLTHDFASGMHRQTWRLQAMVTWQILNAIRPAVTRRKPRKDWQNDLQRYLIGDDLLVGHVRSWWSLWQGPEGVQEDRAGMRSKSKGTSAECSCCWEAFRIPHHYQ